MLDHIKTYRAGESGYYAQRARGTVNVLHDSKIYIYRRPWQGIKKFKRELLTAFSERCSAKISGHYPQYEIETEA